MLKDRNKADINLFGQDPIAKVGTFEAFRECITHKELQSEDVFPALVLYGDCIIKKELLSKLLYEYFSADNNQNSSKKKPRVVWVLIESRDKDNNVEGDVLIEESSQNVYLNKKISGDKIIDIFEDSIKLNDLIDRKPNYSLFLDTGIMIISSEAWINIKKLVEGVHRPSSRGIFSFTNLLRQALVLKNIKIQDIETIDIDLTCIIADSEEWTAVNYPWEILELNKKLIKEIVKNNCSSFDETINTQIGIQPVCIPDGIEIELSNKARIIGPCILEEDIEIGPYSIVEGSFIGKGTKIESSVYITNSEILHNVNINQGSRIEMSIIMESCNIYCQNVIVRSIIGKNVLLGVGTKTPCKVLRRHHSQVIYFSDLSIIKIDQMGSIIGDYCQIGSDSVIYPGRRIGKNSIVHSSCQISKNIRPNSDIKNKVLEEDAIYEEYK